MKNFILFLIFLVCVGAFALAFLEGIKKQEQVECYKAQSQSVEFPDNFFMNLAWKNTCDSYGIEIDSKFVRPADFDKVQ